MLFLVMLYSKKVGFFLYNAHESSFLQKKKKNLKFLHMARSFLKTLSAQISVIILKWSMGCDGNDL